MRVALSEQIYTLPVLWTHQGSRSACATGLRRSLTNSDQVELQELVTLGPTALTNKRKVRYHGDGSSTELAGLAETERTRARLIYSQIQQIGSYANLVDTSNLLTAASLVKDFDRVVYNLANNAAKFSSDGMMTLSTFLVAPGVVRWVVRNSVSQQQNDWLLRQVGDRPERLFLGGLTHGGTGIGMLSCARFTADAFGLSSPQEAVDQGYVGARLLGNLFCCWFHWPSYTPTEDDDVCPCGS